MGKEHDLLQAAKSGNVAHIEKILGHKARKSGIQGFISRTVNPNHQDELGNTPLHYAALNGHRSSAELLLKYDASTNIPDNNGNYPLHLAAWSGHADVAKVLINTGPSRANANEQNGTEDTALHSAAQFGHSLVVAVLLENHADPYVRNSRQESPLDLAAQYGRMETVKQLLNYHPNLLEDVNVVQTHTPLHLASKNGHMNVVSYFLSCGMDVNLTCTTGTALHEAALFGKADVVNLLLQCGIDVTVVDSNNKTVLDLLASHPSTKAKEIRDLIFASSLKEPTSSLKRQLTEFQPSRKPFSGIHAASTIHGYPGRPVSAVYQRNLSYDDVPNPIPYRKDVDPSLMRRSGTYDAVPSPRSRQSLERPNYDIVPPPKEATSPVDWTKYDEVEATSPNTGYALIGPAEDPATGTPPVLTPHDIQGGYTLLGTPAQEAAAKPLCPVRPDSTYATVRPEGEDLTLVRNGAPSQRAFDDYSRLGFPTASEEASESAQDSAAKPLHPVHTVSTYDYVRPGRDSSVPVTDVAPSQTAFDVPTAKGEESDPMPISEMVGNDNHTYLMVGEQSSIRRSQLQRQNSETYDFVQPKPRAVSQSSVYEVPPPSALRGRGNGQESDAPSGSSLSSRASRGQSFDLYENTSISTPPRESQQRRASDYDLVAFPARKASVEGGSYDLVPPPTQVPQDQPSSSQDRPISMSATRAQGGMCPLATAEGYDFVQIRKPGTETNDPAPEMQPFAPLPGYIPMGPPQDTGYEVLSTPAEVQEQLRDYGGTYETLSAAGPQRAGSQTEPGSRNIPVSAPLYEVPPIKSPPVYEIVPPPRTVNPVPPLPPRQTPEVQPRPPSYNEVQWIEKEPTPPQVPPRRQNEYSRWHPGMGREPGSPVKSPKRVAYEQVRIEGPKKGADAPDWDREKELSMQRCGGDYCTLSPTAVGPIESSNRDSTASASSEKSSIAEPVMTPPFSPPSPRTAEAALFEAFGSFQLSDMSTIPEAPEDVKEQTPASEKREAPIPKPRRRHSQNATKPKILPRNDSLYDEEFDVAPEQMKRTTNLEEANQDPFSFPPVVESADVSPNKDSPRKGDFAELHKRFSPFSSREDIFTYTDAPKNEREEPDGAETESDVKPSPLIYENVLFRRSDTTENDGTSKASENGSAVKQDESANRPGSYRLSTLSADSPMNEMEEWEKIEAFLSSIGQIEVPQTLEEQIAHAGKADSVPSWLNALDLAQYESSMMANGFDNINFLNGVLEDEDLLDIGIVDFSHRRTIMEALKSLPACPRLSDPTTTKPEGVKDWLELICLPEYFEVFQHNGYTSMDRIHMLWAVELTSVLEVNSLGHRKRILASIKEDVKEPGKKEQAEAPNLDESSAQLQEQLAELKKYCPDEKPPAVPTATPKPADDLMAAAEQMVVSAKEVYSKNPQQVASKTPKEQGGNKWKHDSSVLIKRSVNYTTLYLGSHAVKTIRGLESTIDACRKMRLSTAKLQKIPSVILSVSVKGIKFIDARSKIMVSYHDMRNISYITQDQEERCVFAYIAKDAKTDKHYCHVFRVESNALSDEVTMTIGQAFELAFSQFVQAKNRRSKH